MHSILAIAPGVAPVGALVARGLEAVERRFAEQLETPLGPVDQLCRHVERYRGKMLRPTLVLISGLATDERGAVSEAITPAHVTVAAVIEMIHMATLVHDDVLDEADVRRGGDTVNKRRGNETAVILGDYLLSKSFHLCSTLDAQSTSLRIGEVTSAVCEGEMLQLHHRGDLTLDERTYFEIIGRKTAALIGVACELGARLAGAPGSIVSRLAEFGMKLGSAFQIQDDLLDVVGDERVVGKSLGRDLEKVKLTLPLIHHLATAPRSERLDVPALIERGGLLNGARPLVAAALERTGSIAYARGRATALVREALGVLEPVRVSPAKDALQSLARAVVERAF